MRRKTPPDAQIERRPTSSSLSLPGGREKAIRLVPVGPQAQEAARVELEQPASAMSRTENPTLTAFAIALPSELRGQLCPGEESRSKWIDRPASFELGQARERADRVRAGGRRGLAARGFSVRRHWVLHLQ